MTCFSEVELTPQTLAERQVLEQQRAHARSCRRCARRLADLEAAEQLLAAVHAEDAAAGAAGAGPCPEPGALLTALNDGLDD